MQLLEAYLTTNRLEDAKSHLSQWLAAEEIADVLVLQAALRVSRALRTSGQIDDSKRSLISIEKATRRGVSSQQVPLPQRLFMADDVLQLGLYGEIAMQYLELGDWGNAHRLSNECLKEYKSLEEKGRFILPTQAKQAKYCLGRVLLEQGNFDEAEPLLLASLLTDAELSDAADSTTHEAAVAALNKIYAATNRPDIVKKEPDSR